jgi:N-acetylglutamate synthase-like GNAT family acetyltransferase
MKYTAPTAPKLVLIETMCKAKKNEIKDLKDFCRNNLSKDAADDVLNSIKDKKTHFVLAYNSNSKKLIGILNAYFHKYTAYIRCVHILPDHYGRGIVQALVEFELAYAKMQKMKFVSFI